MSKRATPNEHLRAGTPFAVGGVTLLPIERIVVHAQQVRTGLWFSAAKEPHALVVRDADGIRAFTAGAARVSLEQLRKKIGNLDALLASL